MERTRRGRDRDLELLRETLEDQDVLERLTPHEVGRIGEALAIAYLQDRGYSLEEQGYRCREGEADLIMLDEGSDEVVLVEVKTRRARSATRDLFPELAVDARKRDRYARIAARYCRDNFPVFSIRFDVVGITLMPGPYAEVEHFIGAYEWEGER